MKKLTKIWKYFFTFTAIILSNSLFTLTANAQFFKLHENGVTITCEGVQPGETGTVSGKTFTAVTAGTLNSMVSRNEDVTKVCTSLVTNMVDITRIAGFNFNLPVYFNQDISSWDVSNVTDMTYMFHRAVDFDSDLSNWDVSKVTSMEGMFGGATSFNSDLSNWDVSKVTNMSGMFGGATSFNNDLSNWDVSKVTHMSGMFSGATSFNNDLSNWNVSRVIFMTRMFWGAEEFNQDIGSWDVSNVADMSRMFHNAFAFNQDIGSWNVSRVSNMSSMFNNAKAFNQDLNDWDVSKVRNMGEMFKSASMFTGDIGKWEISSVTNLDGMFHMARTFKRSIRDWCVERFSELPNNFVNGAPISYANLPIWGTCPGKPEIIALIYPKNDSDNLSIKPVIKWEKENLATLYEVEIYNASGKVIVNNLTDTTSLNLDNSLKNNQVYYWRVRGINEEWPKRLGNWSDLWSFRTEVTTSTEKTTDLPQEFTLQQNYPNPFNPTTNITYGIPEASDVRLEVFNMLGQKVATLINSRQSAGWHTISFDARGLSSGFYVYRIQAGEFVATKKLMLLK